MSKKKEELDKKIAEAKTAAQHSLDGYVALATKANEHLDAGEAASAGDWLNLTAQAYGRMAGDVAKVWTTGIAMLDILAEDE